MEIPFDVLAGLPKRSVVPKGSKDLSVFSGRTALRLILQAIKGSSTGGNHCIALPSYLCDSLLDPCRLEGFRPVFYGVNQALRIQAASLRDTVQRHEPAAVLFINYFGFPRNREEIAALRGVGNRTILIEDCVQGSLLESASPPVGATGDFVFTSYRKYLPVPDGGLLINRSRLGIPALPATCGMALRITAKVLAGKLLRGQREAGDEPVYLELFREAEEQLAAQVPLISASKVSCGLVSGLREGMMRRRSNFRYLSRAFKRSNAFRRIGSPLFHHLSNGVSPLVFPIQVFGGRRDSLRAALCRQEIYCPIHWKLPASILPSKFPASHHLAEVMLGLPIDQRYASRDMARILQALLDSRS